MSNPHPEMPLNLSKVPSSCTLIIPKKIQLPDHRSPRKDVVLFDAISVTSLPRPWIASISWSMRSGTLTLFKAHGIGGQLLSRNQPGVCESCVQAEARLSSPRMNSTEAAQ